MKKNLAFLLLFTLLAVSSCGDASSASEETTVSNDNTDTTTAPTTNLVTDDLGDWDFNGVTFDMLTRVYEMVHANLNTTDLTGDVLNDAIYERNRRLEERFNFTFTEEYYSWDNGGNDFPRQFLLAGDDTYELYSGRLHNMFAFAADGLIIPAGEIPHIDHTKPYWDDTLYELMKLAGKYRFVVGDFNLTAADFTNLMVFNKAMAESYQIGNLYEMVRSGKWTLDTFGTYAKMAVHDLDGNQVMDENDQYGYVSIAYDIMGCFWTGSNADLFNKDEDDLIVFNAPNSEKVTNVFNRIYEIMWDDAVWHINTEGEDRVGQIKMFTDNKSLFAYATPFYLTTSLRETTVDFGVLPFPKWDEAQENYYSRIEGCELFGISSFNENPEMAGIIMEAMACDSYNNLKSLYYDVILDTKGTRDEDSVEMLEIILENHKFDYGETLCFDVFGHSVMVNAFKQNNRNFASLFAGVTSKIEATLEPYHEGFAEHDT